MRIKDLLDLESLSGLHILAGAGGRNRMVSSVSVMDAPDICDWMRGGELLITSGYTIHAHPVDLEQLIEGLNDIGVAALGIKVDRFIHQLPESVLQTADRLRFPLVYIPTDFAFVDIIDPVLAEIVNRQARELQYSERIHDSFLDLALEGKGIQDVVDTLQAVIQKAVVFKDHLSGESYASRGARLDQLMTSTTAMHEVAAAGKHYGYLYILHPDERERDKYERIAIEHASAILILVIEKRISNREIEYRYRSELIHDILTGNYRSRQEIQSRAELFGWRFERGMRVIAYDIDDFKAQYLKQNGDSQPLESVHEPMTRIIKSRLGRSFRCYYTHYSDKIVFLVEDRPGQSRDAKDMLVKLNRRINSDIKAETGYTTTAGIGGRTPDFDGAEQSYAEAELAVRISRLRGRRDCAVFHEDLGIYRLLHDIYSSTQGLDFVNETLNPLLEYDNRHDTDFYPTLAKIIETDWNLRQASRILNVHYNTVKYRLARAEEILGLDLSLQQNKLKVALAVCWKDIASC
jgi:purine catabolism regulator